ncbi:hypothetical protein HGRIS_005342 [Hohenbuehelia grisea]|uniref:Uncharacterized protein n=1 Tax=Hohenbuehelia grisea TaxID=104357 RepID=A0ABR3JET0_9AGAR
MTAIHQVVGKADDGGILGRLGKPTSADNLLRITTIQPRLSATPRTHLRDNVNPFSTFSWARRTFLVNTMLSAHDQHSNIVPDGYHVDTLDTGAFGQIIFYLERPKLVKFCRDFFSISLGSNNVKYLPSSVALLSRGSVAIDMVGFLEVDLDVLVVHELDLRIAVSRFMAGVAGSCIDLLLVCADGVDSRVLAHLLTSAPQ